MTTAHSPPLKTHKIESNDPLAGWDPRRRAALERLWRRFSEASDGVRLSDEVIADRRREVPAADHADLRDEVVVERRPGPAADVDGSSGE